MKTMNKTLAWFCIAVLTLTLVSAANAEGGKQRTGKVVRIKGEARYSTGNKIWQPLKVGVIIHSGNVVQTAPSSYVDIVVNEEESAAAVTIKPMSSTTTTSASAGGGGGKNASPDQDVVRILDDTYLVFDSLTATTAGPDTVTETLLDLKKGSIFGSVKKQAAASRFEVKIPNGVAGIRGTIFLINADGKVSCMTGSVVAAYTGSTGEVNTQVVGGGQQFNCATGQGSPLDAASNMLLGDILSQIEAIGAPSTIPPRGKGWGPYNNPSDHVSPHTP